MSEYLARFRFIHDQCAAIDRRNIEGLVAVSPVATERPFPSEVVPDTERKYNEHIHNNDRHERDQCEWKNNGESNRASQDELRFYID